MGHVCACTLCFRALHFLLQKKFTLVGCADLGVASFAHESLGLEDDLTNLKKHFRIPGSGT